MLSVLYPAERSPAQLEQFVLGVVPAALHCVGRSARLVRGRAGLSGGRAVAMSQCDPQFFSSSFRATPSAMNVGAQCPMKMPHRSDWP
jgi:hypothetical protein